MAKGQGRHLSSPNPGDVSTNVVFFARRLYAFQAVANDA